MPVSLSQKKNSSRFFFNELIRINFEGHVHAINDVFCKKKLFLLIGCVIYAISYLKFTHVSPEKS